ncbi:MAG: dihydroxyacetone kinase subunit L [Bacteroidetes bacterium]|jgi:dihydroxyacetone kinase-like protein|nr:dihydroxyacetone kinase subunit L [Bacteroidota bacterium]
MITTSHILLWIETTADYIDNNSTYLTKLDTAIGDADHGNNMKRGFTKVRDLLPSLEGQDIGSILKSVAMKLISSVGGASGPLFGTFYLQASNEVKGAEVLDAAQLGAMLASGLEGIKKRGKAEPEDKTIIDALEPAVNAYQESAAGGGSIQESLEQAVSAAEKGAEATIPMIAKKGRASYMGERSKGHKDPGATSTVYILKALQDAVSGDGE